MAQKAVPTIAAASEFECQHDRDLDPTFTGHAVDTRLVWKCGILLLYM